jgi:cell division protease FtsH
MPQNDTKPSPNQDPNSPPGPAGPKGPSNPPPVKFTRGIMSWVIILSLLIVLLAVFTNSRRGEEILWKEFAIHAQNGDLIDNKVLVEDSRITGTIKPGVEGFPPSETGTAFWVGIDAGNRDFYLNRLDDLDVTFKAQTGTSVWLQLLLSVLPFIIIILIIWFFIARSMRSAGAGPGGMLGSFGKSKHRISSKDSVDVTFKDVAGIEEAKEEVRRSSSSSRTPRSSSGSAGASRAACC